MKGDTARYIATAEGAARVGGVGYDPSAMAGYPVGTWNSVGKKGYELLGVLLPNIPLGQKYYVMFVVLSLIQPLVYWAVALRLVSSVPAVVVLAVSLVVWHLDSQVSFFWGFGNVLYPGSCAFLPLAFALAWQASTARRPLLAVLGLGAISGWIFYAHTATEIALVVPVGGVALWAATVRKSALPLLWVGMAALIGGGLAAPWLFELLASRTDCEPQPAVWFHAGPKHLIADLFGDRGHARPFDRNLLLHFAVVAGIAGSYLAWRRGNGRAAFVGIGGVWCLVVTYTFSYFPSLSPVQPYRFLVPAVLCLAVPACLAVNEGWRVFRDSPPASRGLMLLVIAIFTPAGTGYLLDLAQPPVTCGLLPREREILDRLATLPGRGRVVCQLDAVGHLIPCWTGKPVIGGLNDQAFVKHRFTGMNENGILFGRSSEQWGGQELRRYLTDYAVEYAIFSSPEWVRLADTRTDLFTLIDRFGTVHLYRVKVPIGYVHQGRGSAIPEQDHIKVFAEEPFVVLKFHYSDRLRAPAGVTLEPVRVVEDDPVPFLGVRIKEPMEPFELRCR